MAHIQLSTLNRIKDEVGEWTNYNFDTTSKTDPLLGVVEETGELSHAVLKSNQGIRGTQEEHKEAIRDAIGDIMVYLLDFMNRNDIDVHQSEMFHVGKYNLDRLMLKLSLNVGLLSGTFLSYDFDNLDFDCDIIIKTLEAICETFDWSLEEVLIETWSEVSQRDWVENPETGG